MRHKRIGSIESYYGGLYAYKKHGRYFWYIKGAFNNEEEEISESLFNELLKHKNKP